MISEIEKALIALVNDCLPDEVDVAAGPGEWDDSYFRGLLTTLPAVRIVFEGGVQEETGTDVFLNTTWIIYIAVGWKGGDEASRRTLGHTGAYALIGTLLPAVNAVVLKDGKGEGLTALKVKAVQNMWTSSVEAVSVALFAITLSTDVGFDPDPSTYKADLDDFLKAGVEFRLPDDPAADLPDGDFDLPQ